MGVKLTPKGGDEGERYEGREERERLDNLGYTQVVKAEYRAI